MEANVNCFPSTDKAHPIHPEPTRMCQVLPVSHPFRGKATQETSNLQQLNPTEAVPHDNSPTSKEEGKAFIQ